MKLKDAAVDVGRIENGAWVDNIPDLAGLRVKVRGSGNKQWRKTQQQLLQAVPRSKRANGSLDPDEQDRITNTLLLNCGLVDWEGLERDDGVPIPYNIDDARKILTDPQTRRECV